MATVDDIDAKSAVRKFLERQVVVDREDQASDSAEEVQASLESVAVAFLLSPQVALYFVLLAKNALQQNIQSDIDIIDYLIKATDDVENPDTQITDTSDLVEAQAALVEVDRLGRLGSDVKAYDRYSSAVNRFLDRRLASSLKRRRRNEFERSGFEAKQDLFRVLAAFEPVHSLLSSKLSTLSNSITDFESVDLTRIVSTRTVSKVRTSLQKVLKTITNGTSSKTVVALELLAGAAALQSISNVRKIFDPLVDTGTFPTGREIRVSAEPAKARARGTEVDLTYDLSGVSPPWVFAMTVDPENGGGTPFSVTLPHASASGRAWVASARADDGFGNFTITDDKLYVQLEGPAPTYPDPVVIVTVTLPTGVQTFSTLVSTIDSALSAGGYGNCVELAPNSFRFLIYGDSAVTKITLRSAIQGSFDISGNYTASDPVANETLGFVDDQESRDIGLFTPEELADLLGLNITGATFEAVDNALEIESDLESVDSSLLFSAGVADELGFSGEVRSEPSYLVLVEDGEEVDPTSLGLTAGSMVAVIDLDDTSRSINDPIASFDGTHMVFESSLPLPRVDSQTVRVVSPLVQAVQTVLGIVRPYVGTFDDDSIAFQRLLSPLLSRPTLAQVNDAKSGLQEVRARLDTLRTDLMAVTVREDQTEFVTVARSIIASLEERGLDRAVDLLAEGSFSSFFSLTSEIASKSSRFMKAIEEVGRNDFPSQTIEGRIRDLEAKGTTPSDAVSSVSLSDDGEDIV